jgi:hypothetical protein
MEQRQCVTALFICVGKIRAHPRHPRLKSEPPLAPLKVTA